MAPVALRDIRKSFGQVEVIHGVNVDITDGEFVILVGPSGCGKSTLLRMIAGLEQISKGDILIGERVVNDVPPKERDIAMVFQNYALYPHMTVADNMGFSLKLRRTEKRLIEERVNKAAEILGLKQLLDRYPRQLSGGQRQRVAMGRAIVRDPQVFLFDEPLSNLDAKLRVAMRTEIKELHQRLGTTTVYVTHDQIEAMTMADKIVVMHDGEVEQIGAPLDLYDKPRNLFVAGFIGSPAMNFLNGKIVTNSGLWFETANGRRLPVPSDTAAREGQAVVYGIRPEHLAVRDDGAEVEVVVVEPTGAEVQIFARLDGQQITAVLRERLLMKPGSTVKLAPRDGPRPPLRRAMRPASLSAASQRAKRRRRRTQGRNRKGRKTMKKLDRVRALRGSTCPGRSGVAGIRLRGRTQCSVSRLRPQEHARGRRRADALALEALRAGGRRRLHAARREFQGRLRRHHQRAERVARRRAAESFRRRQRRSGPGHGVGALLAAAPLPRQARRLDRPRQPAGQRLRRLGRLRDCLRQVRRQVDRHPRRLQRQHDQLPRSRR